MSIRRSRAPRIDPKTMASKRSVTPPSALLDPALVVAADVWAELLLVAVGVALLEDELEEVEVATAMAGILYVAPFMTICVGKVIVLSVAM